MALVGGEPSSIAYVNPQAGFFFGINGKPAPRDGYAGGRMGGLPLRIPIALARVITGILSARRIVR